MAKAVFTTDHGTLYKGDCLDLMGEMEPCSVDLIFADPPFNLNKEYGKSINDKLSDDEYLEWNFAWIDAAVPLLSDGGALWVYNLPKWNIPTGAHLMKKPELMFRHQVAVSMKSGLPIPNKLYPAHYSLLYFTKGKPRHFTKLRTPFEVCRHCGGMIKDYGGHKNKMHPEGVSLTDVWTDLSPVRHRTTKYRQANALPEKMLERVISISTEEEDLIFDPFGGSGTTYAVAERMHRKWIGIELGETEPIEYRLRGERVDGAMPGLGDGAAARGQRGLVSPQSYHPDNGTNPLF